jgi:hypothetical protein
MSLLLGTPFAITESAATGFGITCPNMTMASRAESIFGQTNSMLIGNPN